MATFLNVKLVNGEHRKILVSSENDASATDRFELGTGEFSRPWLETTAPTMIRRDHIVEFWAAIEP